MCSFIIYKTIFPIEEAEKGEEDPSSLDDRDDGFGVIGDNGGEEESDKEGEKTNDYREDEDLTGNDEPNDLLSENNNDNDAAVDTTNEDQEWIQVLQVMWQLKPILLFLNEPLGSLAALRKKRNANALNCENESIVEFLLALDFLVHTLKNENQIERNKNNVKRCVRQILKFFDGFNRNGDPLAINLEKNNTNSVIDNTRKILCLLCEELSRTTYGEDNKKVLKFDAEKFSIIDTLTPGGTEGKTNNVKTLFILNPLSDNDIYEIETEKGENYQLEAVLSLTTRNNEQKLVRIKNKNLNLIKAGYFRINEGNNEDDNMGVWRNCKQYYRQKECEHVMMTYKWTEKESAGAMGTRSGTQKEQETHITLYGKLPNHADAQKEPCVIRTVFQVCQYFRENITYEEVEHRLVCDDSGYLDPAKGIEFFKNNSSMAMIPLTKFNQGAHTPLFSITDDCCLVLKVSYIIGKHHNKKRNPKHQHMLILQTNTRTLAGGQTITRTLADCYSVITLELGEEKSNETIQLVFKRKWPHTQGAKNYRVDKVWYILGNARQPVISEQVDVLLNVKHVPEEIFGILVKGKDKTRWEKLKSKEKKKDKKSKRKYYK